MEAALIFWALAATGAVIFLLRRNRSKPETFDGPKDSPVFEIREAIRTEAKRYGLSPEMCLALAEDESNFNPTAVNVLENAIGIYQIRPIAFQEFINRGKNTGGWQHNELIDPEKNIRVGVWYLNWIKETLARNWGREPSHREIILSFKGGVTRVLDKNVSEKAIELTERALAREVKFA